jgi:methionine-gamma-lyase
MVLGGVVSGSAEILAARIDPIRQNFGGVADPFAAWMTSLGLRTLAVRIERHVATAAVLARLLEDHPRIVRVFYPKPGELPAGQLAAGGPMLSFEVDGGEVEALAVIDRLSLITLAPTLGTLDTLVQHPYTMSHSVLPEATRLEMGIAPGILRVSAGLEDPGDLIEDLSRALS